MSHDSLHSCKLCIFSLTFSSTLLPLPPPQSYTLRQYSVTGIRERRESDVLLFSFESSEQSSRLAVSELTVIDSGNQTSIYQDYTTLFLPTSRFSGSFSSFLSQPQQIFPLLVFSDLFLVFFLILFQFWRHLIYISDAFKQGHTCVQFDSKTGFHF